MKATTGGISDSHWPCHRAYVPAPESECGKRKREKDEAGSVENEGGAKKQWNNSACRHAHHLNQDADDCDDHGAEQQPC
jgi:hypothetical protein